MYTDSEIYDRNVATINKYTALMQCTYDYNGFNTEITKNGFIPIFGPNVMRTSDENPGMFSIHPQKPVLDKNAYGFYEMKIDSSQIEFKGSPTSYENNGATFSMFVLGLNAEIIAKEAYDKCKLDALCAKIFEKSNEYYQEYYRQTVWVTLSPRFQARN